MNPLDMTSTLTIGIKGRHKPSCRLRRDPEGYTRPDACECFLGAPTALQAPPPDPTNRYEATPAKGDS